jgi:two-component system sporulation sensor kinase A
MRMEGAVLEAKSTQAVENGHLATGVAGADESSSRSRREEEHTAEIAAVAAIVTHDVGNIANNMSLNGQLLRRGQVDVDQLTATILQEVDHLRDYVRKLREVGQVLSGDRNERCCLVDAARYAAARLQHLAASRGVEVRVESSAESCRLAGSRSSLDLLAVQLCRNAVESAPNGGRVTLRIQQSAAEVSLLVSDGGVGVPEGMDVFQPFMSTKAECAGLGLAIVRQIATAHQGSVRCTSNVPCGSVFEVRLPR